jgi:membrane protease YdiL (CAAX protease family)
VLSPDSPLTPWILGAVFALLLTLMAINAVRKDRREFRRFKRLRSSVRRRKVFRKWVRESFLVFGGSAVVVLLFAGQFVPRLLDSVNASPVVTDVRAFLGANNGLGTGFIVGAAITLAVGTLVAVFLARRETDIPAIGDVQALLPRNRKELPWGAALAVNAGVVEELLFRLAMPALVFGFTGDALVSVAVSIAVFGLLHAYQGIAGVLASTIIGAVLMLVYLGSGSILLAIAVHALFDLRSLVLIPIVVFGVHKEHGNGAPPLKPAVSRRVVAGGARAEQDFQI